MAFGFQYMTVGGLTKELYNEYAPEKKTVAKGAAAIALLALAGAAIYNREAIKGFATEKGVAIKPYLDSAGASIKEKYQSAHDFVMDKFNHIFGGAKAGDAPTIGGKPVTSGLHPDANGTWGWHA